MFGKSGKNLYSTAVVVNRNPEQISLLRLFPNGIQISALLETSCKMFTIIILCCCVVAFVQVSK